MEQKRWTCACVWVRPEACPQHHLFHTHTLLGILPHGLIPSQAPNHLPPSLLLVPTSSISALQGDVENETTLVPDPIQQPQGA